jgi:hypothetical protein
MEMAYAPDHEINGLSRRAMTALAVDLGLDTRGMRALPYSGGELVGLSARVTDELSTIARQVWPRVVEYFEEGRIAGMDEAHLLSMVYSHLGVRTGDANAFIRRLWTQPFRTRNVAPEDVNLALWHVPAEKRYGLRRLFDRVSDWTPAQTQLVGPEVLGRYLGVPENTWAKVLRDTGSAAATRGRSVLDSRRRTSG